MANIVSTRIPATPRNKRLKQYSNTVIGGGGSGGGSTSVDLSGYLKLSGEESQTVEGSILATGDLVAYAKDATYTPSWPIATDQLLGMVKIGSGISVTSDGTISSTGGGGGGIASVNVAGTGNAVTTGSVDATGKVLTLTKGTVFATQADLTTTNTNLTTHINDTVKHITSTERTNWNDANTKKHTHDNKTYLDVINQNLSTTSDVNFGSVKAVRDVVAYSTGSSASFPKATTTLLGCVIADGTTIGVNSNGKISVIGGAGGGGLTTVVTSGTGNTISSGTVSSDGKTLTLNKDFTAATAADLTTHTGNTTIHTSTTEKNTWNNKQDKLVAGNNITISGTTISAANGLTTVTTSGSGNTLSGGSVSTDGKTLTLNKDFTAASSSDLSNHTSNTTVHITSTERTNWNTAYNNNHTHSNKSVLDGISSTNTSNWNTAYNNNHTHSNKSYLDTINQSLSTSSSVQFGQVRSTADVIAYSTGSGGSLPICTTSIAGCCIAGSGLSVDSSGRLSVTGGSGGNMTVSTTGSGNAITALTASGSVLTATKETTFATSSDLSTHTSNTTVHITSTERSTWNGKQDKLTAGTGISISGTTISATGSGGSSPFARVDQYNNSTTTISTTYTSGLYWRSGYVNLSGSLAANSMGSTQLWMLSSSCLSLTANVCLTSTNTWTGQQLVCNVGWDAGSGCYRVIYYNPTSSSISLSGLKIFFQGIMPV